jgi:adenylate cyclase
MNLSIALSQDASLMVRSPRERLRVAFAQEEFHGLALAFKLRLVALMLVALLLFVLTTWPQVLYYHALMLGFVATGALSLIRSGKGADARPAEWTRWFVPLADAGLVVFALAYPNPLGGDEWMPRPMTLRLDNMLYFMVFVALSSLSYSPRQVLWAGIAGAICWVFAAIWIGAQPGVVWAGTSSITSDAALGNPQALIPILLVKQVFLLLVVSGLLASAVARSRSLVLRQVAVERERTQLARYFSANMVDELADADRPLGEIRSQTVAVLFVDIVGFTKLAESEPPEAVIGLLREFHRRMQAAVFAHRGTLDKYLGDGLMASFGTPRRGPRDAADALAAARAMASELADWNRARRAQGQVAIRIGVGLHWGPVVLGDIGGENRLEFATIGDTVNVASRLEHMTRDLAAEIAASGDLIAAARASVPAAEADELLEGFASSGQQSLRGRGMSLEIFARPATAE